MTGRVTLLGIAAALAGLSSPGASADEPVGSSVRYNREIVRIFDRKCVTCHTAGGLAVPFDTYFDVRPWGRAIREEILERRMPPWPAAGGVRALANEMRLTVRELAIITAWVDGQTPRGEPSDLPPPRAKPRVEWQAGEPDAKLALPSQTVSADGVARVRRATVRLENTAERWLRGFDIAPGERRALRSAFLYLDLDTLPRSATETGSLLEKRRAREAREVLVAGVGPRDKLNKWLAGWTPWHAMTAMPPGVSHRLPKNASLVVELHYGAWGEQAETLTDRSVVGLYFDSSQPPAPAEEITVAATLTNGERKSLRGEAAVTHDAMVWAIRPRLASGDEIASGSVEVSAIRPDGGIEPLLWIKENSADWQIPYVLRDPVRLGRGSRVVIAAYANDGDKPIAASASLVWYPAASAATAAAAGLAKLVRPSFSLVSPRRHR